MHYRVNHTNRKIINGQTDNILRKEIKATFDFFSFLSETSQKFEKKSKNSEIKEIILKKSQNSKIKIRTL